MGAIPTSLGYGQRIYAKRRRSRCRRVTQYLKYRNCVAGRYRLACSVAADEAVLYRDYVNPEWSRLLSVLQMDVRYDHCAGAELFTSDGRRVLDFLSGYCVHNLGHNHPAVIAALHEELDRSGPAMLQSHVPELAGELAAELCRLAGGRLEKVYFCSSGSEGVETVIKFARLFTRRSGLLYCAG